MIEIATKNNIPEQVENTWRHSECVWKFAEKIADAAMKNGYVVDKDFLKIACFSHDFGRMYTGSKGSKELLPAVQHGVLGAKFFRSHGYEELARVCERHIGGIGLSKEENKKFGLGNEDCFVETIEEIILGYADARTSSTKKNGKYVPIIGSFQSAFRRFTGINKKNGKKLIELQVFIKEITGSAIK